MSQVKHTLTLFGLDTAAIQMAMAESLSADGWTCVPPGMPAAHVVPAAGKWETPGELAKRLRLHIGSVSRSMVRPDCPRPAATTGGPGRIVSLISTPALEKFLTRHKWKGGSSC